MPRGKDKLVHTARVHHATVTNISKGETPRARHRKTTGVSSNAQTGPKEFDSDTVDPRVWEMARKLCEGDFSRIVIESPQSVVIYNTAKHKQQKEQKSDNN